MIITKQSQLDSWFDKAINDPETRRWLAPRTFFNRPVFDEKFWERIFFMEGNALAQLSIDRQVMEVGLSLYNNGSKVDAAIVLKQAFEIGMTMAPLRALNTSCATTNVISMKINRQVFGEPWGIKKEAGWDAGKGAWVDEAFFRKTRAQWEGADQDKLGHREASDIRSRNPEKAELALS